MIEFKTKKTAALIASDWGSRTHVLTLVLMTITVIGIYFSYELAAPFLPAIAWALSLAILFAPLHCWLESKVKSPNIAAALSVLIGAVLVVVPVTLVAEQLISEAGKGAETIKTLIASGEWRRAFEAYPLIAPIGQWIEQQVDLSEILKSGTAWLTEFGTSFVQGSLLQLIGIIMTFYLLFYFLRDRSMALQWLRFLSPLKEADMTRLFDDVNDTVHATLYGTFVVAVVQGTLGGLMFWWLDLPAPLLWGIVMGLLAFVPVLGAFIIWIPAAIFLVLTGSADKAVLLTLWGVIVIGGIDNLLYPMLVGKRLKMHTVLAFISIVGGLTVFGASGLILGPVIFTVTKLLLEIWSSHNTTEPIKDKGHIQDEGELIYKVIDPKLADINIMKHKECARAGRSLPSNNRARV